MDCRSSATVVCVIKDVLNWYVIIEYDNMDHDVLHLFEPDDQSAQVFVPEMRIVGFKNSQVSYYTWLREEDAHRIYRFRPESTWVDTYPDTFITLGQAMDLARQIINQNPKVDKEWSIEGF